MSHPHSRNPANGQLIKEYPFVSQSECEAIVRRTAEAQKTWREVSLEERRNVLLQLAAALRERNEELAAMATREMGKPITQSRAEVNKCAQVCEWYAEHGPAALAPQPTLVENKKAWQEFRPLGTILAVMPWNFPYWQILRGAAGMLLAGNTYLLKHAPNVMGCAYLMKDIFDKLDAPAGIFDIVNIDNDGVSALIADSRVAAVAVTGSVRAGSAIAAQAGAALKKTVLELGGSDPFIVLADADLDEAVKAAVIGRYQNTGQVCMAAKRFIIEESIAQQFEQKFTQAIADLSMGDPTLDTTYLGPMARYDLRDELHQQVEKTLAEGARLVCGGEKVAGEGNYYAPTILAEVGETMTAFREEVFGPVATLTVARDAQHALELANNSDFGLAATVWTADNAVADQITRQLETGAVFVNGYGASDPRVTIGGVKKSGYGRELNHFGLHEFCNIQTVWVDRR
ncbi:aldehyde dehydrogenase family protein [Rosenbergiella epipactidis]|uniref:aldehyde dehydrogenase family protein n=1 Tax=Rosenbergiella epipactidis TaxID=1544694 RepID=UPI00066476B8|nr:aldehyde dehydrogenase family protein [Rosenbergiella epipactidis]KMV67253.1 succinate dehydrogenase [bacteria symbiont BFo2 of Frankliniella occidentalis]KYP96476.1 succinate dehydrogenase [bacteria symbiont BFo2 of Frankliniella occidentalis]